MQENMIKYYNYKEQSKRLTIALKYKFYVEAVAIEYAIIEDRIQSILNHSGVSIIDKDGCPFSIQKNINRLKDNKYFNEKNVRKKVPLELINNIYEWKEKRNKVIHALLKKEFQKDEIEKLALQGNELRKQISNKAKSMKLYNENLKNKKEKS